MLLGASGFHDHSGLAIANAATSSSSSVAWEDWAPTPPPPPSTVASPADARIIDDGLVGILLSLKRPSARGDDDVGVASPPLLCLPVCRGTPPSSSSSSTASPSPVIAAMKAAMAPTSGRGKRLVLCSAPGGCANQSVRSGVCVRHGARKHKRCTSSGCTNIVKRGGVCIRHGAEVRKCSGGGGDGGGGCRNNALKDGVCVRHGATRKTCGWPGDGCKTKVSRGGLCARHGNLVLLGGGVGCEWGTTRRRRAVAGRGRSLSKPDDCGSSSVASNRKEETMLPP